MAKVQLSEADGFVRGAFKYKIGDVVQFDSDRGKVTDGVFDDGNGGSYIER